MKPDLNKLINRIRESPLLKDVPEEQLLWLADNSDYIHIKEGDYLFKAGEAVDRMFILLKGRISYIQKQNGNTRTIDEVHTGEVTGALPYSRANSAITDGLVQESTEALCLHEEHFREMILNYYELTEALVHIMTTRVREFTRTQQQSEKMAALGKLSAGLAHELNNPASAVVRNSASMKKLLTSFPEALQHLLSTRPKPEIFKTLKELFSQEEEKDSGNSLSLLDRSTLVDEQADWLESHGFEHPYELAEAFSGSGVNLQELQQLEKEQELDDAQLKAVLSWFSKMLDMTKLAEEIHFSSKRISELVNAVKTYSHMDRSPEKESADLTKGIADTLTMLNFKIRKKNIKVTTSFPDDLPEACVYAGELNQLWTNLIDNSIDALDEGGEISIALSHEEESIKVTIQDNGEGIPQEIQDKIFDPFFTTKTLGKGSGMGLEIAKNIVEDHDGSISLDSEPGKTVFTIHLPL